MVQGADPVRLRLLICALGDAATALDRVIAGGAGADVAGVADIAAWCRTAAVSLRQRLLILETEASARMQIEHDARATAALAGALRSVGLVASGFERRSARDRAWAAADRQFLLFDPAGDGRVAEVHGNLVTAVDVAVLVPGVGTTIDNFDHVSTEAAVLAAAASPDGTVAVIAWLGYDPPDSVPRALAARPAATAASVLTTFLATAIPNETHLTVIGHSYGSLVVGMAARDGMAADDVVLLGSPGVAANRVSDLGLPDSSTVWAARAPDDPIGLALDPLSAVGFGVPGLVLAHHFGRLVFGQDPASAAFGAVHLATGPDVHGHGEYFKPGSLSLENVARVVNRRRGGVVLEVG